MTQHRKTAGLTAVFAAAFLGLSAVQAGAATRLEQAEVAGLSPQLRAQVLARATHGNSVTEVLLLNNIKIQHETSLIVALDWDNGVAVVQLPNGGLEAVHFDPHSLEIRS